MFQRKIYEKIKKWKTEQDGRTALLVEGQRRVGKSTVVEEFGKQEYESYILLDYKTDRKISADRARARYQFQINLYSDAVTAILGKPIAERYIFLLDAGQAVRL